jgi:hypothetical protein
MAIIDPDGFFGGDRLRRCSNAAQLHWPRLFLASDGFARLEINYARIIGRCYGTFNPIPSETEIQAWIAEYAKNYLLFLYEADGQVWGQWDTPSKLLKAYKIASDHRSPVPPEPAFTEWKHRYLEEKKALPKFFKNLPETFLHGVGVGEGVGKNTCASGDARGVVSTSRKKATTTLSPEQAAWFQEWWSTYWRKKSRGTAEAAFARLVTTPERFREVMTATRALGPEMMRRDPSMRPYGATWLNAKGWEDEPIANMQSGLPSPAPSSPPAWEPPADWQEEDR